MEFLKRHYEKLVLAVLLLLFIGSMVYLLQIVQETAKINREGLTLPTRDPDFTPVSPTAEQFDRAKLFAFGNDWTPAVARNEKHKNYFSDLVVTFGAARCGHCERIIPLYFFENRECPLCGKKLVPPPKVEGPEVVLGRGTPEDPDGCGIPHAVKEKFGLDVNDPGNVLDDLDGDGFSNLYEYKQKTLMNEPRSRPPLWHRLVLVNIDKIKLPFMLMKVNTKHQKLIFLLNKCDLSDMAPAAWSAAAADANEAYPDGYATNANRHELTKSPTTANHADADGNATDADGHAMTKAQTAAPPYDNRYETIENFIISLIEDHNFKVLGKYNIDGASDKDDLSHAIEIIPVSAKTGMGLPDLRSALASTQQDLLADSDTTLITNARHYEALSNARDALVRVRKGLDDALPTDLLTQDIREALYHIGSIVGEISTDEVLGNIFRNFCIGK